MAVATLSRGGTSVTIQIWAEGGELLVGRDVGKPQAGIQEVARADPRSVDHKSATDSFTIVGQLIGSNAYADARTLAEDLIKPHSAGERLMLDLSDVPGLGTYEVGVPSPRALELDYQQGQRDWVPCSLTLPVVSETIG